MLKYTRTIKALSTAITIKHLAFKNSCLYYRTHVIVAFCNYCISNKFIFLILATVGNCPGFAFGLVPPLTTRSHSSACGFAFPSFSPPSPARPMASHTYFIIVELSSNSVW